MASAKKSKSQSAVTTAMEVGAGIAAAAAAGAAGYYFYGDKGAKKHRAAAAKWAKGMKADVIKEAKKAQKLDQKAIAAIVDKASAAYVTVKNVDKKDLTAAARELKKHWKSIEAELQGVKKQVTKAAKKAAPAAKKAVTKAVKKATAPAKKAVKKAVKKAAKKGGK